MKVSGTLLRACGQGNKVACAIARKISAIYAGSVVSFTAANSINGHPNKMPFNATLLICDEPSDKPPHGSQGHRILVRSNIARKKLSGLPGMAVNYDPSDMDEHETGHKVGVITKAWMEGPEVKISGFVWKKDFPEAERDLKKKDLGTSMELADVYVEDENASVWNLTDFEFTGATILKRNAAAYTKTSLAASARAAALGEEGEKGMKKNKDKKHKVAAAREDRHGGDNLALITQAISGSLTTALAPVISELKASNERVVTGIEELKGLRQLDIAAAADEDDDDEVVMHAAKDDDGDDSDDDDMEAAESDDDDDDDMTAAKDDSDDDDDDDDMAANGDDESSDSDDDDDDSSDLEAMEDLSKKPADWEPGEVNKSAANRGSKTTVTKPPRQGETFPGNVAKGRLSSAAAKKGKMKKPFPGLEAAAETIRKYAVQNRNLRRQVISIQAAADKKVKKLRTKFASMEAQLEHFAEIEGRRSQMSTDLVALAAKSGVNLGDVKASGQKFTVPAVDRMFANAEAQGVRIDPAQRIAMKMQLEQEGMMEDGEVVRNYGR